MGTANPPSQPINNLVSNPNERGAHIIHNQISAHAQASGPRMDNNSQVVLQERNDRGMHGNDALIGVGGDVRNAFGSSNVNIGTVEMIHYLSVHL